MTAQHQTVTPLPEKRKPRFDFTVLENPTSMQSARKWAAEAGQRAIVELPLDNVLEDPDNPRTQFETETLYRLATSIKARGVMQPILVREKNDLGLHIIIHGARRYRGSKIAGKTTVPAIIIPNSELANYDDYSQVIENTQRENLNAEDICAFILKRLDKKDSKGEIAEKLGLHPQDIARYLVIKNLPDNILMLFRAGKIDGITPLYDLIRLQKKHPERADALIAHAETDLGEITRLMIRQAFEVAEQATQQPKKKPTPALPSASEHPEGSQSGENLLSQEGTSPDGEDGSNEQEGEGVDTTTPAPSSLNPGEEGASPLPVTPATLTDLEGGRTETGIDTAASVNAAPNTQADVPPDNKVVQLPFHNPESHKASGDGRIPDPNHIKKPLLLGMIGEEPVKLLLTRRPSAPGLVHVSYENTMIEEEVGLDAIVLTLLSDMKVQEAA
jgi:ParB family chromosome partitioning protein